MSHKLESLVFHYLDARDFVTERGFGPEIDWQEERDVAQLTERSFLREYAWVVVASGISEKVARRVFDRLCSPFHQWRSAKEISASHEWCRMVGLASFRNERKIDAILETCRRVSAIGFAEVHAALLWAGLDFILTLPYMGPATSRHLAKNIGLDMAKPDRHLVRLSRFLGYATPAALCGDIASATGDKLSVVDLVLWRYSTLDRQLTLFTGLVR